MTTAPRTTSTARYSSPRAKAAGRIGAVGLTNFDTKRVREMVDAGAGDLEQPDSVFAPGSKARARDGEVLRRERHRSASVWRRCRRALVGPIFEQTRRHCRPRYELEAQVCKRVLGYAGGYGWLQNLLAELRRVGDKHGASIANVATKWVLGSAAVPAVILGARNATHVEDYKALFSFELDDEDRAGIRNVLDGGKRRPRTATRERRRQMVKRMASLSVALARKALLESVFQGCAQQSHARIDVLIRALAENGLNH